MSAASNSRSEKGKKRRFGEGNGFEEWGGYMPAKIHKLQEQSKNDERQKISDIFTGVSIFVNGYTRPTPAELKRLILEHGGWYHHYYSRTLVSHIVASNLPNSKVDKLTDKKVVRPGWITDSISAGKLLLYQDYLLYPDHTNVQPRLPFVKQPAAAPSSVLDERADCDHNRCSNAATDAVSLHDDELSLPEQDNSHRVPSSECAAVAPESATDVSAKNVKSINKVRTSKSGVPSKAGDGNFVAEFYSNSRLHHISTWGAELKEYVRQLQKEDESFPAREKLCRMAAECRSDLSHSTDQDTAMPRGCANKRKGRTIMHIDMDSFFVSVGLRNNPHLKGKPVAVTHSSGKGAGRTRPGTDVEYERAHWQRKRESARGRGNNEMRRKPMEACPMEEEDTEEDVASSDDLPRPVASSDDLPRPVAARQEFFSMAEIASCSYEARQAGVKNGMLMGEAKRLCPQLVPIHYDFDAYREVSQALYDTVASYTHDIEAVSCDEMLIDCTDLLVDTSATPLQFASLLRREIREKTQCNASSGIASNILMAKLATRRAKPNGQFHLLPEDTAQFIKDKSISDLPGVGWTTTSRLHAMNVETCAQLQRVAMATLQREFGRKTGEQLSRLCRGEDDRCVTAEKERKSVSAEINYGIRFNEMSEVEKFLEELAGEVHNRLVKVDRKGKQISLKVKVRRQDAPMETAKFLGHGVCDNMTKSVTLLTGTQDMRVIAKECVTLVRAMRITPSDFRGVGIQVGRLEAPSAGQQSNQTMLSFVTSVSSNDICHEASSVVTTSSVTKTVPSSTMRQEPILPPLPTLLDISSPVARHPNMQQGTSAVDNEAASDWLLPSPSQMDLAVFAELPEEIQKQLRQAMTERQRKKHPVDSVHRDTGHPGCSHWTSDQQHDGDVTEVTGGERSSEKASPDLSLSPQPIVALPSYSQLDPSCLAALPGELREELEKAYEEERNKHSTARAVISDDTTVDVDNGRGSENLRVYPLILQQAKSYNSPGKSPAKSPRRGTRAVIGRAGRGRRRGSPKKLQYDAQQKTVNVSPQKIGPDTEARSVNKETRLSESVNLCGAVNIDDVKRLLSEWLQSSHSPSESDVDWIAAYLARLVNDLNLEMVAMVMRYLHRQVMKKLSHQWLTAYQTLTDHVQAVVCSRYGAMLKLPVT